MRLRSDIGVCLLGVGPAVAAPAAAADGGFALIVGRMWAEERYKGHDRLIDIWSDVCARVPRARLVVVGEGDDRPRLEARAVRAGVERAVTFLGRVGDAELAGLYLECAFFVMPSPNEGFGLAFVEAMRAGKPCIAVHGSADEIIRDGIDGFVLEPDAAVLCEAVVRLFSNDDERARMGRAARARAEDLFTSQRFADRLRAALGPSRPVPAGLAS